MSTDNLADSKQTSDGAVTTPPAVSASSAATIPSSVSQAAPSSSSSSTTTATLLHNLNHHVRSSSGIGISAIGSSTPPVVVQQHSPSGGGSTAAAPGTVKPPQYQHSRSNSATALAANNTGSGSRGGSRGSSNPNSGRGSPTVFQFSEPTANIPQPVSNQPLPRVIVRQSILPAIPNGSSNSTPTHSPTPSNSTLGVANRQSQPVTNVNAAVSSGPKALGLEAGGRESPTNGNNGGGAGGGVDGGSILIGTGTLALFVTPDSSPLGSPGFGRSHTVQTSGGYGGSGGTDPQGSPTSGTRPLTTPLDSPSGHNSGGSGSGSGLSPQRGSNRLLSVCSEPEDEDSADEDGKQSDCDSTNEAPHHLAQRIASLPTPSPAGGAKRQHASWSLPQRNSVSGGASGSGFSPSTFRPMMQKEIYAHHKRGVSSGGGSLGGSASNTPRLTVQAGHVKGGSLSIPSPSGVGTGVSTGGGSSQGGGLLSTSAATGLQQRLSTSSISPSTSGPSTPQQSPASTTPQLGGKQMSNMSLGGGVVSSGGLGGGGGGGGVSTNTPASSGVVSNDPSLEMTEIRLRVNPNTDSTSSTVPTPLHVRHDSSFIVPPTTRSAAASFSISGNGPPPMKFPKERPNYPRMATAHGSRGIVKTGGIGMKTGSGLNNNGGSEEPRTRWETFLYHLNTFPTRIPGSKKIAMYGFHPGYLIMICILTIISIFALDFTFGFLSSKYDFSCDILLLVIGSIWCLEFLTLSMVLPGYLLLNFWWYIDLLTILSIIVDIQLLHNLSLNSYGSYNGLVNDSEFRIGSGSGTTSSQSFHGSTHSGGQVKFWLFFHYIRVLRLFKYYNGVEGFGNAISLQAAFIKLAWRGDTSISGPTGVAGGAGGVNTATNSDIAVKQALNNPFHKSSTLGLHLTNLAQKQITCVFFCMIMLFTLLSPLPIQVNNNSSCIQGDNDTQEKQFTGKYSDMKQWSLTHIDSLYRAAVRDITTQNSGFTPEQIQTALSTHASFVSATSISHSLGASFGSKIMYLSVSYPTATMFQMNQVMISASTDLKDARTIEVVSYQCNGSLMLWSNFSQVHDVAIWNILLQICLIVLYILSQTVSAYNIASCVSHPLERMSKVVRKMAGTVLFLQSDMEAERDPWEQATMQKFAHLSQVMNNGVSSGAVNGGSLTGKSGQIGQRRLSKSSSRWYLSNKASAAATTPGESENAFDVLGGWIEPALPVYYEFDLLEEVVTKMSSVFNLLPGGLSSLFDNSHGEDKARRMMVGSRRTEIKTRDSILTIDVVERPITAVQAAMAQQSGGHANFTPILGPQFPPRLSSIESKNGQNNATNAKNLLSATATSSSSTTTAAGGVSNVPTSTGTKDENEEEFFSSSTLLNPVPNPSLTVPAIAGDASAVDPATAAAVSSSSMPTGSVNPMSLTTMQNPAGRASILDALPANSALRFESHPELRSLEELLSDPFASIHFKQYLHKKFCLETITFYEQVTKYKARMQSWAFRIYHQFVVAGAPNEINIHSAQRQLIANEIFHPTLDTFNLAQKEVYKLMKNNFMEFLVSHACLTYLTAKQMKQLTIRVGEEHL